MSAGDAGPQPNMYGGPGRCWLCDIVPGDVVTFREGSGTVKAIDGAFACVVDAAGHPWITAFTELRHADLDDAGRFGTAMGDGVPWPERIVMTWTEQQATAMARASIHLLSLRGRLRWGGIGPASDPSRGERA